MGILKGWFPLSRQFGSKEKVQKIVSLRKTVDEFAPWLKEWEYEGPSVSKQIERACSLDKETLLDNPWNSTNSQGKGGRVPSPY